MYCEILIRRAFSFSSSSCSIAAAFLFSEGGVFGMDTRSTLFATRAR